MKKTFFILIMIGFSFAGKAQTETEDKVFFMGINGGIDYNMNANKLGLNETYGYKYLGMEPGYNIGIDLSMQATKKLKPRIELRYVNLKYAIDWNPSPYKFGKTIVNVNYFDFNLHFDYSLVSGKKFQLFVSPALKFEIKGGEPTLSTDNWSVLQLKQPSDIAAIACSAIFKYNLSENTGLTLTPEYTYFLHEFATGNTNPYQRLGVNLGIEFKFGD